MSGAARQSVVDAALLGAGTPHAASHFMGNVTPEELLKFLNARIGGDPGAPGLAGSVGIGVRSDRDYWLWVELDDRASATLTTTAPENADALMILGEVEALALLTGEAFPDDPELLVAGDAALLTKFFARYASTRSMVATRMSAL